MMEGYEMQAHDADVSDRILGLVRAILKQNAIAAEVLPDSKLVDVGLTSMDMVNLMLSVEAEFDSRFRKIRSRPRISSRSTRCSG